MLDPRVVRSSPSLSVACACVPGQNTIPLIAGVFSERTLKIVGPLYRVPMPGDSNRPHSDYTNVTYSGLTHSAI